METLCTLLGQCRVNDRLTLSVLRDPSGRFLLLADTSATFLGLGGRSVYAITDEPTAWYFARCFAIPEPELFIEHCPHFRYLGDFEHVFSDGLGWQTVAELPHFSLASELDRVTRERDLWRQLARAQDTLLNPTLSRQPMEQAEQDVAELTPQLFKPD